MTDEITSNLAQKIAATIINQPTRKIGPTDPLISTGLIDSFGLVDLAMLVEDEYNVRIADSELNQDTFDTLDQLAALIRARQ
ncbi:MAG TPA: acyl carrier protein [Anaerolineaceae bacterium]